MTIHTVTLPNGKICKRTSQGRTYTHVVAVNYRLGKYDYNGTLIQAKDGRGRAVQLFPFVPNGQTSWSVATWCGSLQLAQKAAASGRVSGRQDVIEVQVLPCESMIHTPKPRAPKGGGL